MRKYPKYKASGVDWLGEIPSNWTIKKYKYGSSTLNGFAFASDKFSDTEGMPLIRIRDLTNDKIETFFTGEYPKSAIIKSGDLLVGMDGDFLLKEWSGPDALLNQRVCKLLPRRNFTSSYLKYIGQYPLNTINELTYFVTVKHLSDNDIKNTTFPIPSLSEQHAIVRFLDYKTGQIDSFIANRQKQIELLKEQLRKKMYTTLTKGLSNKELKSTQLPWFPEIPKNWELYKFNAAIKLLHGFQFRDNHFKEHGVKVAKITQLKADGTLDLSEASFVEEKFLTLLKDKIIKSGDILMALTGGTIGKIICVDDLEEEVLQNYRVGKFIPKDKRNLNKEYMFWVLSSEFTFAQILFLQRETGQPNIGISDFSKMFFPMPDTLEEQIEITKFIVDQKSETNTLISKYQKQIDLMQEYRTSLISQAVTGKIDVREWQPKKQQIA